eukprot:scaffold6226_cov228-Pinguiococcus_pyrenoidosus.AAC.4
MLRSGRASRARRFVYSIVCLVILLGGAASAVALRTARVPRLTRLAPPRVSLTTATLAPKNRRWTFGFRKQTESVNIPERPRVAELPAEERFLRDVKWLLIALSPEARRCVKETGTLPPEIAQALLDQYQVLYLFRDVYNDMTSCLCEAQRSLRLALLLPVQGARGQGRRASEAALGAARQTFTAAGKLYEGAQDAVASAKKGYEALRAAMYEAYTWGAVVAEGTVRRFFQGQSQARRRRRIRVLGSPDRARPLIRVLPVRKGKTEEEDGGIKKSNGFPEPLATSVEAVPGENNLPAGSLLSAQVYQDREMHRRALFKSKSLQAAFAVFDANKEGSFSVSEMRRAMRKIFDGRISRTAVTEGFEIADTNGDGRIDFAEFAEAMDSATLLNPDRMVYGKDKSEAYGAGYSNGLLQDNYQYSSRGIKGKIADAADELSDFVDKVLRGSTLPTPSLFTTVQRWRRFQAIKRRRAEDNIKYIESSMGEGLQVWKVLQEYPNELVDAMERKTPGGRMGRAPSEAVKKPLTLWQRTKIRMASWTSRKAEELSKKHRPIATGVKKVTMLLPRKDKETSALAAPVRQGRFGRSRDGAGMDANYRRLVAVCASSSASTIRSFQRATDRWRDDHISTPAYVRATRSLFGSATEGLLRPIAQNVPEAEKGAHLNEVLDRLSKGGLPEAAGRSRGRSFAALPSTPKTVDVREIRAAPREGASVGERDSQKAPTRLVPGGRRVVPPALSKAARAAVPVKVAEASKRIFDRSGPVVDLTPPLPGDVESTRTEVLAKRAATAASKSAVVGFLLKRPLTGGELETLEIKIRVFLEGGLTARNLYDSVGVLVGDIAVLELSSDKKGSKTITVGRRQRARAVHAVLGAALTQMPRAKQRLVKKVLDGLMYETDDVGDAWREVGILGKLEDSGDAKEVKEIIEAKIVSTSGR